MRDAINKLRKSFGLRLIWWGARVLPAPYRRIFMFTQYLGREFRKDNPEAWVNIAEDRPTDAPPSGTNVVPFEPRTLH